MQESFDYTMLNSYAKSGEYNGREFLDEELMQPEPFMVFAAVGYLGACSDANFDMNPTNRNEPGLAGKEAIKATGIIRETERETTNEAIQPTIAGLRVSNKCKIKNSFWNNSNHRLNLAAKQTLTSFTN